MGLQGGTMQGKTEAPRPTTRLGVVSPAMHMLRATYSSNAVENEEESRGKVEAADY